MSELEIARADAAALREALVELGHDPEQSKDCSGCVALASPHPGQPLLDRLAALEEFWKAAMDFARNVRSCTGAPGLAGGGPCMRCQTEAGSVLSLGGAKAGLK